MPTIAASKLTPPALPRDLVARPALRRALDEGVGRTLTLVCAPPGFGKSLLLSEWVKRCPEISTAWVSVDEDDEDPCLLWSAVLAALRGCPAVPPSSRLHRLVVSRTTVDVDFIEDLLAALRALPQPLRLILDDVQHLRTAPVQEDLRMLVRGRPPGVHLVLASRLDPVLPLARLRLDDQLCELRAEQLRFSAPETATLFEKGGVRLDPAHRDLLHERTGGWVAGLRLAERSMRCQQDPDRFIAAFSGDERSVSDYLVSEVLAGITDAQRAVLLRTSVADPVPAELAVALCDREDAADILDSLCRDLGLVTATGTGRADYRVQELLRSHLLGDLQRCGGGRVEAFHRRAANWWDRRGAPAQALRHAGQAGDRSLVTDLLGRWAGALVARGEHSVLRTALTVLGDDPAASAWRATLTACLQLESGDRRAVAEGIGRVRALDTASDPDLTALLTATERLAGLDSRPPGTEPEPRDRSLRAMVLAGRGVAHAVRGSPAVGRTELGLALDSARRLELPFLEVQCLCALGAIAWAGGDLRAAQDAAAAATVAAREGGWDNTGWAACALAITGLAALERGSPRTAADTAAAGLRAAHLDPVIRLALHTAHAGASFDQGEKAAGLLELQQALADVTEDVVPAALAAASALLEHRIALRLGYATAAAGAASWLACRQGTGAERLLMRAWVESGAGAFRTARATVGPLLRPSARPAWPGTVVEAWLVVANAGLETGDRVGARQALRTALDCARPLDVVRPFMRAPAAVQALLVDELVATDGRGRFAGRVLAVPQHEVASAAVVLTARESDVLARLPSLLNLEEIAGDLEVSVNTVKSHVRSIYDKLGAGTRRTAVLAAHERGLLR